MQENGYSLDVRMHPKILNAQKNLLQRPVKLMGNPLTIGDALN